ncbi:MAG: hypothetical protein AAFV33_02900, partial [Chloroflexota bacterium]
MTSNNQARSQTAPFPHLQTIAICCGLPLLVILAYVLLPVWSQGRSVVLPLDDVYIHFQYAKQIANGAPYVYNPGLPPSSGATSLIYPYLLSIGHAGGLTGLSLGWWALAMGTLAFMGCCWLILHIGSIAGLPEWGAVALTVVFATTGSIGWHFMSGMETGLLIFFMLLTMYALLTRRFVLAVVAVSLMAVTRPEGAIMAIIATVVFATTFWREIEKRLLILVALPVAAQGIQPLLNRIFTGSTTAAGSSAKSILSMVPAETDVIVSRVWGNFTRMWWEFATGYSLREGLYLPVPLLILALVGMGVYIVQNTSRPLQFAQVRRSFSMPLMVTGWLAAGTLAVATLDPAFWHFKRYQMPFMVLFFPLAAWALAWMGRRSIQLQRGLFTVLLVSAAFSNITFWRSYQLNVGYLLQQQIPMAAWLRENTPEDAVVAVHDVGMMRYLGDRTTVDMVGLTTNGAADSWRNGPGAVAEFMHTHEPQPDYVASYTDALGLSYLADTPIYGETLAEFPVELSDNFNVALAGAFQGVWRTDWSAMAGADAPRQPYPLSVVESMQLADAVNVANLASEQAHAYTWQNTERLPGFPTEVYAFDYAACETDCMVMDGGRRINGHEEFTLALEPGTDTVLVTRVHPAHAGSYDVFANGERIATRTLPVITGQWIDIATLIPGEHVSQQTLIRIVPATPGGHYMPYYHLAYQGDVATETPDEPALATFDDMLSLTQADVQCEASTLLVNMRWHNTTTERADYRVFVHVYDDTDAPPVAQADRYPIDGATPPGNVLPGEVSDVFVVNLSNISSGLYTIAAGFYDPGTGERLSV